MWGQGAGGRDDRAVPQPGAGPRPHPAAALVDESAESTAILTSCLSEPRQTARLPELSLTSYLDLTSRGGPWPCRTGPADERNLTYYLAPVER